MPLLHTAFERYPKLPFVSVILDAGYESKEFHRDIYTEFNILSVIIRKPSIKWGPNLGNTGTSLWPFVYPTRRKGIEFNRGALSSHVTEFVSKTRNASSSVVSIKNRKPDLAGSLLPNLKITTADKDPLCRVQDPMSN